MQAARSAISLSVFLSVSNWEMAQFRAILRAHRGIASIIPHLFRQNNISPPEGYQAERLVEMLEDRHGGPSLPGIMTSLREQGPNSPHFREIRECFQELTTSGGSESNLRREWNGDTPDSAT